MGMELTGVVLATSDIRRATNNINAAASSIEETMKAVDQTMTTLTGQSEGSLIEKTTEAVRQLSDLIVTLIDSIHNIASAIMSFLEDILAFELKAKNLLEASLER